MNIMPSDSIVVSELAGNTIKIRVIEKSLVNAMSSLGFSHDGDSMTLTVIDEKQKIKIINNLIEHEALFTYGHGWYPSEVVGFYKDKNMISKEYNVISWSSPSEYSICRK